MPRKSLFQGRWLKDIPYQEWVLKDKLDKCYAQCMACDIQLLLVFLTVVMVLTKSNTGPDKILIWLLSKSLGTVEMARGLELPEFVPPGCCACHLSSGFSPGTRHAPHSTLCSTCCKCLVYGSWTGIS